MKKFLPFGLALFAFTSAFAGSDVPSQYLSGEGIHAISSNGIWIVSEMSSDNCMAIRNLVTGEAWGYIYEGGDFDDRWDIAFTTAVSDDGTVVGEYNNIPSYWRNGKWTNLRGAIRDDYGNITAVVGGITPDGSMIVGGVGKGGSMFDEGDSQMTFPCVWYRQEDGTYGDPVWLPNPGKDYFGQVPQYFHATCISEDGKTVGATMRSGMGFHHFPYAFVKGDDGQWTCRALGEQLINPRGIPVAEYPGEYWGPDQPNYELYMTQDQLNAFYSYFNKVISDMYNQGITDEKELIYLELEEAMKFMSEENRAIYEPLVRAFLDQYPAWDRAFTAYLEFLENLDRDSASFVFNNMNVSPDGRYVYATATGTGRNGGAYGPVRFDMQTGETVEYEHSRNLIVTCITDDYSVLAKDYNSNDGIAYIFPSNSTKAVSFLDYWKDNEKLYSWMEHNMYVQVVTSMTSNGSYNLADKWCMGRPVCTPDMSLFGFSVSTEYWYPAPADNSFVSSFIINPEMPDNSGNEDSGISQPGLGEENAADVLAGGVISLSGSFTSLDIFDMSGTRVFHKSSPSGIIIPDLNNGIYIVTAVSEDGSVITKKAVF